ncbi:hypothetical protein [Lysinibacillus xylanilyticus]|uniref:hypothetical protein n=1 Tax=Lysinibacillus xylanilyticus TaxID=582475 RepID=UPI0037F6631E
MNIIELIYDKINSIFDSQSSFLKTVFTDFTIEILIILSLIITLFVKYKQNKKDSLNNWKSFKDYILENKSLSLALSTLVIAIGMIGAGIVNYISVDNSNLGKFNVAGIAFLFLLCIALYLITPLINFRFKYKFIAEHESLNAKFIYSTYKRANNLRRSTKGLLSAQLFEIHENTYDTVLSFKFKEIWNSKEVNTPVNKIKNTAIDVPLEIWGFLESVEYDNKLNSEFLNKFTILKKEEKKGKIYVEPIYLLALFDYLKETFFLNYIAKNDPDLMKTPDLNSSITKNLKPEILEEIEKRFEDWIEDWIIPGELVTKNYDYKSIHYLTFFNLIITPFYKDLNTIDNKSVRSELNTEPLINTDGKINSVFLSQLQPSEKNHHKRIILLEEIKKGYNLSNHIYKGFYNKKNPKKTHRCYYNLSFTTSSIEEGQKNFIILMVCDNRFIPTIDSASSIFEIMIK